MSAPSRRVRFRPLELIGLAAVTAVFIALVVLLGSRSPTGAVIFGVIAFIVSVLLLAMLALLTGPTAAPEDGPVLLPKREPDEE